MNRSKLIARVPLRYVIRPGFWLMIVVVLIGCRSFDPPKVTGGDASIPPIDARTIDAATTAIDASLNPLVDAGPAVCDPAMCGVLPNGVCVGDICNINCNTSGCGVTCPPNHQCLIVCSAAGSCEGIDCSNAAACDINCNGDDSCTNEITPGTGAFSLRCNADPSCRTNAIDCSNSCACEIDCGAVGNCPNGTTCPDSVCNADPGCNVTPVATCDTCPQ